MNPGALAMLAWRLSGGWLTVGALGLEKLFEATAKALAPTGPPSMDKESDWQKKRDEAAQYFSDKDIFGGTYRDHGKDLPGRVSRYSYREAEIHSMEAMERMINVNVQGKADVGIHITLDPSSLKAYVDQAVRSITIPFSSSGASDRGQALPTAPAYP